MNSCPRCRHSWKPRYRVRSARCPECGCRRVRVEPSLGDVILWVLIYPMGRAERGLRSAGVPKPLALALAGLAYFAAAMSLLFLLVYVGAVHGQ